MTFPDPLLHIPKEMMHPVTNAGVNVHVQFMKRFHWVFGVKNRAEVHEEDVDIGVR